MSRANLIEIMGFAAGLVGFAVITYAFWLIAPVLAWFFIGALFVATGAFGIWVGNGGFRR